MEDPLLKKKNLVKKSISTSPIFNPAPLVQTIFLDIPVQHSIFSSSSYHYPVGEERRKD